MKFGLFINAQHPVGESVSQRIAEASEQTRFAREAGFHMICAGQHYLSHPYQMSAIIPLLARLTADAEGMEIAATVLLIPLLNPVDVAETCATLDAMSGGRFVLESELGTGTRNTQPSVSNVPNASPASSKPWISSAFSGPRTRWSTTARITKFPKSGSPPGPCRNPTHPSG